ncbi:MAG: methyltransferase domain-containing protein [Persicimonas sp.]
MMNTMQTIAVALVLSLAVAGCQSSQQQTPDETPQADQPQADEQTESEEQTEADEQAASEEEPMEEEHAAEHHQEGAHGHGEGEPKPHGHRFDKPEEYAERWNSPERDEWQKPDEVIELMGVGEGMTVVDIGAGTGYFVEQLAPVVGPSGKVLALDIEQSMVDYVNEHAEQQGLDNVEARKVAVDDPQLEEASVDRILTVNTWHHIPERVAYAEKLHDALKADGKVAVVDYTMEADQGPPKKMRLEPSEVVDELEQAGFETEVVEESLPKQYIVIGQKAAN